MVMRQTGVYFLFYSVLGGRKEDRVDAQWGGRRGVWATIHFCLIDAAG